MSETSALVAALRAAGFAGRIKVDEPLSRHTSFHVGGPADVLVEANTSDELVQLWQLTHEMGVSVRYIGGGTNILVSDEGMRGLTVLNRACRYSLDDGTLYAESGVALARLARWSARSGWQGLEWACGIPGTVGGAIVGNAGAYGGEIADVLLGVRWLKGNGQIEQVSVEELAYEYRDSVLKKSPGCGSEWIILDAEFGLKPESAKVLGELIAGITAQRKERQPVGWSAGSVFKRTLQFPAGFLIDQAGLKGTRMGQAVVSPVHANYILNEGTATAADIVALIGLVQSQVKQQFSEWLEPEIQLVGDWSNIDGELRDE